MFEFNCTEVERLAEYGIKPELFNGASSNKVRISRTAKACNELLLSFAGNGNIVEFRKDFIPRGHIRFLETKALCTIEATNPDIVLDLWLYGRSTFHAAPECTIFGFHGYIYNETSLHIETGCLFAEGVSVWTSDHHSIVDLATGKQLNFPANVRIGKHVWIGEEGYVLKGVTIGDGSIIAARSLVNRSVPATELWGGSPARCLRRNVSWVASHPANPYDVSTLSDLLGQTAIGKKDSKIDHRWSLARFLKAPFKTLVR